ITEMDMTVSLLKEIGSEISWDRQTGHLEIVTKELKTTYIPQRFSGEVARRQMSGPGGILSFELASEAEARALPGKLRLFRDATSLGGVESLVEWRRRQDPEAAPTLLRVSVGLEAADDLVADLEQALAG
ncbi:MAG TPA: PLP-dependent transferase, partial [Anaeromyxobacteraceae bacterium]|nr:PLP-dependent transferase [Anaeromyxobacteraceae bacterium]